jgi:hypothetical protein
MRHLGGWGVLPRRAFVARGLWFLSLGVWWLPLDLSAVLTQGLSEPAVVASGALAIVSIVLTLTWGAGLGYRGSWRWVLISAVAGTAVLWFWYLASWLASSDPNSDIEASAGLVILALPTLLALGLVLGVGGGIGRTLADHQTGRK